jgi:hypothetical protein
MSVFYLVFSFLDLILFAVADILDQPDSRWFLCVDKDFLLPKNDGGSIFLLIDVLLFYAFSYLISHIFYKIPDNFGLLVKQGVLASPSGKNRLSL